MIKLQGNSLGCIVTLLCVILAACQSASNTPIAITVSIQVDGEIIQTNIPSGSQVEHAISSSGIILNQLDKIIPPLYTSLLEGDVIVVTRVEEEYITRTEPIPFRSYTMPNESMAADQEPMQIQPGSNGIQEVTTRVVYEDGVKVREIDLAPVILKQALDEIIMIGVQNPFSSVTIPGKLAYLTGGNAWIMENTTANRQPIIITGDMDGRVFSLSPDGRWLLFSRQSDLPADQEINTLWVVDTTGPDYFPIQLPVSNVIHFADWQPGREYAIAYSTMEPRTSAPGWQANNDLFILPFNGDKGEAGTPIRVIDMSSGGIYGWWGSSYEWSPDGNQMAYARPDGIGLVDFEKQLITSLIMITPLNTHSEWAWLPSLAWGNDAKIIFYVAHAPPIGLVSPEESPNFDLNAYSLLAGFSVPLVTQTGMFAYPSVSPRSNTTAIGAQTIAFLQASLPTQSATSRYRLAVMDSDGSEVRILFPAENLPGLEPQVPIWSPTEDNRLIAITYEGNIWLVDNISGQAQQITGDGLTKRLDWK